MSKKTSKDKPNLGSMGRLSPGEVLCRARKEKGLAAEEVILHLGITQRTLNALEKDEYDVLPSPLYVKGYIRRYCSILNIPDAEVLADFDSKVKELGLVNKESTIRLDRDSSWKIINWKLIIPIILVLLLVILILWIFLSKTPDAKTKEQLSALQEPVRPHLLINSGLSSPIETDYKETDTQIIGTKDISVIDKNALEVSALETHNTEANFVELEPKKTKQKMAEPVTLLQSSEAALVTNDSQILQINVIKQSWIQILDSRGDILLADLKPSGYQNEVKGSAPIKVTLGYAPGVELTLNGKRVDIPTIGNDNTAKLKIGDNEEG